MRRIIISRTDAIGDVVLTLPLAGIIKEKLNAEIIFFGRNYTKSLIDCCIHVDRFISYDDFSSLEKKERVEFLKALNADAILHVFPRKDIAQAAKDAAIPLRAGTSHRFYHWLTCNKLLHFTRKKSPLHEAQLNCKLLPSIGIDIHPSINDISTYYGLQIRNEPPAAVSRTLSKEKINIILHPHSHGSGREWGLENFSRLITMLLQHDFNVFISGSAVEKDKLSAWINQLPPQVHDVTGMFSLAEFIAFINAADGIVACSTGPLHIAAAAGRYALGIYPPMRPIHPGRWAPVGEKAQYISLDKECNRCAGQPSACVCIKQVDPLKVMELTLQWRKS